jgi:hypothetical protein
MRWEPRGQQRSSCVWATDLAKFADHDNMVLRTIALGSAVAAALIVIIMLASSAGVSGPEPPQTPFPYWTEGKPLPTM